MSATARGPLIGGLAQELAEFASSTELADLPPSVIGEAKRVILDSVGCALGAGDSEMGRVGIELGTMLGPGRSEATIIGVAGRHSVVGAAFANAELVNALDFDAVLPPGHVAPYVVPTVLAAGEASDASGGAVVVATAVGHEMSCRIAQAMSLNRDVTGGVVSTAPVLGYASTVFGTTAAAGRLMGLSRDQLAHALGIAATISPVNAHRAWLEHAPSSTVKYHLSPGHLTQTAFTACHMAAFGHRGDLQALDDEDFGYPRFIGTTRWEPAGITEELGSVWRFPGQQSYKPYPHCRVPHALFDALTEIVEQQDLAPSEIQAIRAWGEAWADLPAFQNRRLERPQDAQFSFPHGLAMCAHRVPPGPRWQDADLVFDRSVLDLMARTTFLAHPDYARAIASDPLRRPSRVEVDARGTTYVATRDYTRGTPSPDPSTTLTDDELVRKFHANADQGLDRPTADSVVAWAMDLERVDGVRPGMHRLAPVIAGSADPGTSMARADESGQMQGTQPDSGSGKE